MRAAVDSLRRGLLTSVLVSLPLLVAACSGRAPSVPSVSAPQRICSTSLAGDELLALLVEPERVACVSSYADDPGASNVAGRFPATIPRIPGRIEPVLGARPDLVVVAPWNDPDFRSLLAASGVRSEVLPNVVTFEDIEEEVRHLGRLFGVEQRAEEVNREMKAKLAAVRPSAGQPPASSDAPVAPPPLEGSGGRREVPLRVLSFSHSIVAGGGTTVDTLIRRAGGVNAAAEAGLTGHKKMAAEALVVLDPDVLLLGFDAKESLDSLLEGYPHLATMRAVEQGRVIILPTRLLTTVTPFLADGVVRLREELTALRERSPR